MPGGVELSEKLPDEMFQLVESFKKFVREQKSYRDQKFDVEPILEVGRDLEEFTLAFQRVSVDSDRNSKLVQQIKDDTTRLLRHTELAYSSTSTSQYFAELADQFEPKMKAYADKIKELKMSLDSIIRVYDVDELYKWLKKQHETLGEIAAKVYVTHERIMEKLEMEQPKQPNFNYNLKTNNVTFNA